MTNRDVVKLYELVAGDVFYLNGDAKKKKQVLIKLDGKRNTSKLGYTYTATYREQTIHLNMLDNTQSSNADKTKKEAEAVEVVFLRHKEAIA